MSCRTESMHCALSSSTGEVVQWGATWGVTFTAGLDGGTIPAAPAPAGASAVTTKTDARTAVPAAAARASDAGTARAPRCCRLIPIAPLLRVELDERGQRNISPARIGVSSTGIVGRLGAPRGLASGARQAQGRTRGGRENCCAAIVRLGSNGPTSARATSAAFAGESAAHGGDPSPRSPTVSRVTPRVPSSPAHAATPARPHGRTGARTVVLFLTSFGTNGPRTRRIGASAFLP